MFRIIGTVFLFILFQFVHTDKYDPLLHICAEDEYCNQPYGRIKCAYCGWIKMHFYCGIIDQDVFRGPYYSHTESCEYILDHCDKQKCLHQSQSPLNGYGECVCFCADSMYGSSCDKAGQTGFRYPSAVQMISPMHVDLNSPAPLLISVGQIPRGRWKSKRLYFFVYDVLGGFLARINVPEEVKTPFHDWCNKFADGRFIDRDMCKYVGGRYTKTLYLVRITVPFEWTDDMYRTQYSYTRQIRLDVYWDRVKLSEHTHRYHVNFHKDNYGWAPTVRFADCGKTLGTAKKYSIKDAIQLAGYITYSYNTFPYRTYKSPEMQANQQLQYGWEAYRVEGDTQRFREETHVNRGSLSWNIPPFRWVGTYLINLTITGYFRFKEALEKDKLMGNFNICFVEIVHSALVAVITGGSSRFVYREDGLTLDASESRNPNVPDSLGSQLRFTFTCNWTQEAVCRPYTTSSYYYYPHKIRPMHLRSNRAYNFTLKVVWVGMRHVDPAYTSQIVVVGDLGNKTSIGALTIRCVYNCGVRTNPKDIVYLRVGGNWNRLHSLPLEWQKDEFDKDGIIIDKDSSVDEIKQSDTPSFILIIKEDQLKENSIYEFEVVYKNSSQFAEYSITTTSSASLVCNINPDNGTSGLTNFNLSCQTSSPIQTFEFYDKHESDEPGFSGRMISTKSTGDIAQLFLTRGTVDIHSIDEYGTLTTTKVSVKLEKGNRTLSDIELMLGNLMKLTMGESVRELIGTVSIITDLLTSEAIGEGTREYILETLTGFLSTLSINSYGHAKLCLSTLYNVLLAARGSMSLDSALHAVRTVHTISQILATELKEGRVCTFRDLYQIFSRILDCLYVVLEAEEPYVGGETLSIHDSNPVIYMKLREISKVLMKSVFFLQSTLSSRHLPAQTHKLIESSLGNLSMWIKVDFPRALSKYTQKEHLTGTFPAIISDNLARYFEHSGHYPSLQFVSFDHDPTGLSQTNTKHTFDVSICVRENYTNTCQFPKVLKFGMQIAFEISDLVMKMPFRNVTIKQLDPSHINVDLLDIVLPVYKLDPMPLAEVDAQFNFYSDNTEILVLVKKGKRPTYENLITDGIKVTAKSPVYHVVTRPSDDQELYYLAIQPGSLVGVNETVSFGLKIYSKLCYTWHNQWKAGGCRSKTTSSTSSLVCECKKLSLVGGLVSEVEHTLEVVNDFPLSSVFSNNAFGARTILALLLLAVFLLAIVCIKADRLDKPKRFVNILPDNFPADKFGFLVRVITGARVNAGTDAVVGLRIFGTSNDSRCHVLSSKSVDVMEGRGEDWFLLFEPETLGEIECLNLWHNNAGAKSSWFCDSITIYDLHNKDCYFFTVNDWITLSLSRFPQVILFPTPFREITSTHRIFRDHFKSGFLLSHLWLDTIIRHPRDPVSRFNRLSIIVCFILLSMVISMILIVISDDFVEVDDFSYSVTWLMLEMSVYTCGLAAIVACVLMFMFKKIYTIIFYIDKENTRRVTKMSLHEDYLTISSITSLNGRDKKYIHYGNRHELSPNEKPAISIAEYINLTLMPKPLVPVQIEGDPANVLVNKRFLITTWIVTAAIIIVCLISILLLSQFKPLPPVKAMKWLTVVGLAVLIHAVILQPLKITLVSALLAVAFKRIIYKDIYTFDPHDGVQNEKFGNVKYLANLIHLRSNPVYQPLHEVFHEEHRHRMIRVKKWHMLYEIVIQIAFLAVIGRFLSYPIPNKYQANTHLKSLMKDIYQVFNTSDLYSFQQKSETYVFKYVWYSWDDINEDNARDFFRKDWMYDSINRMIGNMGLRQFRVKQDYCQTSLNLSSITCAPPYSGRAEDTGVYLPFWLKNVDNAKKDETLGIQLLNHWSYHRPSEESNFIYYGVTGQSYSSGGYTWDLGDSSEEMDASIIKLWEQGWIGHYTRAVLAQVNVYNVNTRLFSEIALVTEQTVAGQILPVILVQSVDVNIEFNWPLVLFTFFAFMLCVRVFMLGNMIGLLGVFKSWRNLFELLITVNALSVLYYLSLQLLTVPPYITEYQMHSEADQLNVFDFYRIAHYKFNARTQLCAVFVLNLIRFFSLWRFGDTLFRIFETVVLSLSFFIWLIMILFAAQFVLFRLVGYLLQTLVDVALRPDMFYKYNDSSPNVFSRMGHYGILYFIMRFNSVIIMALFVSIFVTQFKKARQKVIEHWAIDNYFTFVLSTFSEVKKVEKKMAKPMVQRTTVFVKKTMKHKKSEKLSNDWQEEAKGPCSVM